VLREDQVPQVIGSTAYGSDGQKIGKVGQVYFDEATGQPEWVTVNTGFFGTNESFVPLEGATFDGDRLTVAHIKETVKDAPNVGDDGHLTPDEERILYNHYRRGWEDYIEQTGMTQSTGMTESAPTTYGTVPTQTSPPTGTQGYDTSGPTTDDAMTRSEEQLHVGTQSRETGRARLRKWVDTEYVNVTVPVEREKAALETQTTAPDGTTSTTLSSEQVVLSEEVPVVSKTVEPVQQVHIGKETVTEHHTVSEELHKERVEIETDLNSDRDRT
jgi:uncharacterized protein (TIGR02271 family)